MRILAGLAAAAAAVLALTACGERQEPTGAAVQLFPVTVDSGVDGTITLKAAPARVAVLGDGPAGLLASLGTTAVVTQLRGSPSRLTEADPDLVVASSLEDASRIEAAERALPGRVYVAGLSSYAGLEQSARDLGLLVGQPLVGRGIVQSLESARRQVAAGNVGKAPVKVFLDTGFATPVTGDTFAGDLLRLAGATNVAADAQPGPVEAADLAAWDPDVYLVTSDSGLTLKDLRKDPRTRRLRAVKAGRVAVVDASLLEPGADSGGALDRLSTLIRDTAAGDAAG